jgi:hypothetical protein
VPQGFNYDPTLGTWVQTQRVVFKTDKMDPERKTKLKEIAFDFNLKGVTNDDIWDFQFQKLREYYEKHGHCELYSVLNHFTFILNTLTNTTISCFSHWLAGNVPRGYEEDPPLGSWVNNQRERFRKGRMDQGRKRRLDEISFDFAPRKGKNHVSHCQTKPRGIEKLQTPLKKLDQVL